MSVQGSKMSGRLHRLASGAQPRGTANQNLSQPRASNTHNDSETFEIENERLPRPTLVVNVNEDSSATIAEICKINTTSTSPKISQVSPTSVGQIYQRTKFVSDSKAKRREPRNGPKGSKV
jgi:hypothetical protein